MTHFHAPRSMHDAERRLIAVTKESSAAQAAVTRAADSLVKSGEARRAEIKEISAGTEGRLQQQEARRAARRNGSIETAIEALKVFGGPH